MTVRFVIGRAGTGKTYHCLSAIRERLRDDPIDGPRLIFLVPEQASFQMERAILEPSAGPDSGAEPAVGVAHRADVLSFRRLARRVLDSSSAAIGCVLSETARTMVLRHLLAKHVDDLRYYRRAARPSARGASPGGFVQQISATVAELIEEAISPDDLANLATAKQQKATDKAPPTTVQQAKFHDLHLIYRAYMDYLGTEKLDPTQYLQVAREEFPKIPWLTGAEIWVDGFASFSGQEWLTLIALAERAQSVDITVMLDPSLIDASGAPRQGNSETAELFARPMQTYRTLHRHLESAGVTIDAPLTLHPGGPQRFLEGGSLAQLEHNLFRTDDCTTNAKRANPPEIELVELPSRRVEVDYAVSRICRWVSDPISKYRFRDLAIITRSVEAYHELLSEALSTRGIPFFIDRRRRVAHHPLVELLRAGIAVAAESLSLDSVRLLLKTELLPVSPAEADALENYILAHGISGTAAWRSEPWTFGERSSLFAGKVKSDHSQADSRDSNLELKRINETRAVLLNYLSPWLASTGPDQTLTGERWAETIRNWLKHLKVSGTLKEWSNQANSDGHVDAAEEHREVWKNTQAFLDDIAFAFADVPLSVAELAEVVEAGLAELSLGLVPPTVDQVLVGSIERSRHPDIRAAVVIGLNDGVFPGRAVEDPILHDEDRALLNQAGLPIRPGARQRTLEESTLAYVAMTRASDTMVATYSTADDDGGALRPSPYIDALVRACPGLVVEKIPAPAVERDTWDILTTNDLTTRLASEFRIRPPQTVDCETIRARWNELYNRAREDFKSDPAARIAFGALDEQHDERLTPQALSQLYKDSWQTSVSQLETFAACAFQHFAKYTLKLQERSTAALASVDVGKIHHAILEDFVGGIAARKESLGGLDEAQILDNLQESCSRVAATLPAGGPLSDARNGYILRRSAAELAKITQAQWRQSQSGSARPRAVELAYGFDRDNGIPALTVTTPAGRQVPIRGFIDRVDIIELADELLGIVIDYKRTKDKKLDLSHSYHGLSLQLVAYLLALENGAVTLAGRPIQPIGALYVSLASHYQLVEHPNDANQRELALNGTYRPRGILLADKLEALETQTTEGWSANYNVFRKNDGTIGRAETSDAVPTDKFQSILDHTRHRLGELADGILDGDVSVKPYRLGTFSPCSWCAMASVCRFEMGINEARFLEKLTKSEFFQRIAPTDNPVEENSTR